MVDTRKFPVRYPQISRLQITYTSNIYNMIISIVMVMEFTVGQLKKQIADLPDEMVVCYQDDRMVGDLIIDHAFRWTYDNGDEAFIMTSDSFDDEV